MNQKKSEYRVDKCPCGIFCRFVHSKNEYNYHPDHFRKEFRCTREKNKFNPKLKDDTSSKEENYENDFNIINKDFLLLIKI